MSLNSLLNFSPDLLQILALQVIRVLINKLTEVEPAGIKQFKRRLHDAQSKIRTAQLLKPVDLYASKSLYSWAPQMPPVADSNLEYLVPITFGTCHKPIWTDFGTANIMTNTLISHLNPLIGKFFGYLPTLPT